MGTPKIVPIKKVAPDVDEAIMRADFMLRLNRLRDELRQRQDDDYLFSPNLSLENTQRINCHLADAIKSVEVAICYCSPEV